MFFSRIFQGFFVWNSTKQFEIILSSSSNFIDEEEKPPSKRLKSLILHSFSCGEKNPKSNQDFFCDQSKLSKKFPKFPLIQDSSTLTKPETRLFLILFGNKLEPKKTEICYPVFPKAFINIKIKTNFLTKKKTNFRLQQFSLNDSTMFSTTWIAPKKHLQILSKSKDLLWRYLK